jgi:hypothetical protein
MTVAGGWRYVLVVELGGGGGLAGAATTFDLLLIRYSLIAITKSL